MNLGVAGIRGAILAEIRSFENEFDITLPDEYVSFLEKNNGGQPDANHFKNELFDFFVNVFYGFGGEDTSFDVETMYAIYADRIPDGLIPIADDGVGNLICIGTTGDIFGKIFIWWRDKAVDEGEKPDFSNISLVADSFEEFLEGLQET